jgi:uncharacterized protein YprB with RNaseH-like and TPR domain
MKITKQELKKIIREALAEEKIPFGGSISADLSNAEQQARQSPHYNKWKREYVKARKTQNITNSIKAANKVLNMSEGIGISHKAKELSEHRTDAERDEDRGESVATVEEFKKILKHLRDNNAGNFSDYSIGYKRAIEDVAEAFMPWDRGNFLEE